LRVAFLLASQVSFLGFLLYNSCRAQHSTQHTAKRILNMVKRRGPKAAPTVHDHYDDFSRWVKQALRHADLTPGDKGVTDPRRQWQSLTAPNQAFLAQALREFWSAERRFKRAWANVVALMEALKRKSRQETKRYDELHGHLQTRLTEATNVQGIIARLIVEAFARRSCLFLTAIRRAAKRFSC
jgi:hypothetical protein